MSKQTSKLQLEKDIDEIGMTKFTSIFCDVHRNDKFFVSPGEFFDNRTHPEMLEKFLLEQKDFYLRFYEENMPLLKSEAVADALVHIAGIDMPEKNYQEILNRIRFK